VCDAITSQAPYLECIIDAEQQGKDAPFELNMEDLLNEETGRDREDENEKAAGGVTLLIR
jgi:hypothetical protein